MRSARWPGNGDEGGEEHHGNQLQHQEIAVADAQAAVVDFADGVRDDPRRHDVE